eukprot:529735_1
MVKGVGMLRIAGFCTLLQMKPRLRHPKKRKFDEMRRAQGKVVHSSREKWFGQCDICSVLYNCEGTAQSHLKGNRHKEKVRQFNLAQKAQNATNTNQTSVSGSNQSTPTKRRGRKRRGKRNRRDNISESERPKPKRRSVSATQGSGSLIVTCDAQASPSPSQANQHQASQHQASQHQARHSQAKGASLPTYLYPPTSIQHDSPVYSSHKKPADSQHTPQKFKHDKTNQSGHTSHGRTVSLGDSTIFQNG